MTRAIIFINGSLREPERVRAMLRAGDRLIGADGGTRHILALGLMPDLVVGDLDSIEPDTVAQLEAEGVPIERHSVYKDQTDLELAIECALRDCRDGVGADSTGAGANAARPADEVVLVGATGGRLDQTLANVLILAQRVSPVPLRLVDGAQEAILLRGPTTATLRTAPGTTVSAIPLSSEVTGINYRGLTYPLDNATLALGSTRGISNVAAAAEVSVTIATGLLLVVTGE